MLYHMCHLVLYKMCHVMLYNTCPDHKLVPVLPPKREHRHNLRQSRAYAMPRTHTNRFKNTFIPSMCT